MGDWWAWLWSSYSCHEFAIKMKKRIKVKYSISDGSTRRILHNGDWQQHYVQDKHHSVSVSLLFILIYSILLCVSVSVLLFVSIYPYLFINTYLVACWDSNMYAMTTHPPFQNSSHRYITCMFLYLQSHLSVDNNMDR
jgi:hypothetical protein